MPTQQIIDLATPLCNALWMTPSKGPKRASQHAVHHRCYRPMKYRAADNTWACDRGHEEKGGSVASRLAYTIMEMAA